MIAKLLKDIFHSSKKRLISNLPKDITKRWGFFFLNLFSCLYCLKGYLGHKTHFECLMKKIYRERGRIIYDLNAFDSYLIILDCVRVTGELY